MPTVCRAPAVSLYFEVTGAVMACCHNRFHPLGTVPEDSIGGIWRGDAIRALRASLDQDDLGHGCHACAFEIAAGNRDGSTAATFDQFTAGAWPTRMEFALSNRCNLACVMCNGTNSSRIRAERERLPPLASPYGDTFFTQLEPFLPHLRQARFYGGEPFLIREYQRIWDLMIAGGSTTECNVTTNGTIRSPRVEAVLDALPFSIGVSLDGMTAATVESIRLGASFDAVMANIDWFRDYCERKGTWFGLTYCLMTSNWHEFADFLLYAEYIDAGVAVNRVVQPTRFSLFHLGPHQLAEVLDGLRRDTGRLAGRLTRLRGVWDAQLTVIEQHLEALGDTPGKAMGADEARLLDDLLGAAPFNSASELLAALGQVGAGPHPSAMETDAGDIVSGTADGTFLGHAESELLGRPASQVMATIASARGGDVTVLADRTANGATARVVRLGGQGEDRLLLGVTIAPADGPPGQIHAAVLLPAGSAVSIGSRPSGRRSAAERGAPEAPRP